MPALPPAVRDRILDGAARAVARHGVAKLGMHDVSEHAAVSRGTIYRYFRNRAGLLHMLAHHEGLRFQARVTEAIAHASGAERLLVALRYASEHAREHPVLQRLLETDPAFVLRSLREEFPTIRATMHRLFAPLLADTRPVREGVATADQLVDWLTRVLLTAFLFPDPDPARMARGLAAVYAMLTGEPPPSAPRRRRPRRSRAPRRPRPRPRKDVAC